MSFMAPEMTDITSVQEMTEFNPARFEWKWGMVRGEWGVWDGNRGRLY